jgi:PIN domain nuclease of toxin-antitoxin system
MSLDKTSIAYNWQGTKKAYLLDSCTFLWAVANDKKLSAHAKELIENTDNVLYLSAASAYEIAFRNKLGKLGEYKIVAENFEAIAKELGARELPISQTHGLYAASLNTKHRDPFDRIIASQSVLESIPVITNDKLLSAIAKTKVEW